jgi:hypothetical protein
MTGPYSTSTLKLAHSKVHVTMPSNVHTNMNDNFTDTDIYITCECLKRYSGGLVDVTSDFIEPLHVTCTRVTKKRRPNILQLYMEKVH